MLRRSRWVLIFLSKKMDAAAEIRRNPASKHQIQPEHGDEQADARRVARDGTAEPSR